MNLRKFFFSYALYILSLNCTFTNAYAQTQGISVSEEGPITIGTTLSFQSGILSEERKILLSLPENYHNSTKRYPVIYMLDAQYFFQFQYAYGVINALEFMEEIPEVILVGVYSEDRDKDMMPPSNSGKRGGNADHFMEFFRSELQVFIDQQYRTEPYKILVGHSAGGYFALRTLLQAPDTFNAYVVIDPALWWNDGELLNELKTALDTGSEFNNTLFTSETNVSDELYENFIQIISDNLPDELVFNNLYFPEESHTSTIMPGIHQGILSVYENWKPQESVNTLDGLLSHYQKLTEYYGYTVEIPFSHAIDLGFRLINNNEPARALEVFEYSLANISQDAIAHYAAGFALRRLGRLKEALTKFEQAIALGSGTDMFSAYVQFRDEVVEEIKEQEENSE